MRTPFEYGGTISSVHFVNRTEELDLLERNFRSGQNTILISPRRWGKTSLVDRAIARVTELEPKSSIIQLDLLTVKTEGEFLSKYLEATLKASAGTADMAIRLLRDLASQLVPKLTFGAGPDTELKVGFDWKQAVEDRDQILELPAKIAVQTKAPVVVCVDEFQAVAELTDIDNFDAVLRSSWQRHQNVCYCLYGSKRHMMLNLFGSYGAPFYHFGDAHVLEKISRRHWVAYVVDRFRRFGKSILSGDADRLAAYVSDHSYYVQSLAQLTFGLSGKTCTTAVVDAAYDKLLGQVEPFFSQQIAALSRTQLGFLHALLDGHQAFNSRDILDGYHLGSSANASKLKRVMQEKELVQLNREGGLEFVDPVLEEWLRRRGR